MLYTQLNESNVIIIIGMIIIISVSGFCVDLQQQQLHEKEYEAQLALRIQYQYNS